MQYRTFGKLDWKVSALGFGAMRLPIIDDDPGNVDEAEATQMLRYAIDHGVNYVDTAYTYHKKVGELFVGQALQYGYRERVKLATKLPCWWVKTTDCGYLQKLSKLALLRMLTLFKCDHFKKLLLYF